MQAATVKKERELQKKLLKKERKTFRTAMKVSYHIVHLICPTVSHFLFMLVNILLCYVVILAVRLGMELYILADF